MVRLFASGWLLVFLVSCIVGAAQGVGVYSPGRRVKNVIVLISDGTSLPVLSLARWYARYTDPSVTRLAIDPYVSGTVITYSSNAPIGDSAPTTSCYMTGVPSQTGFVATYPPSAGKDDLVALDSSRAYSPLVTLLEVARLEHGMRTGLVVTSQFPHATPADCAAHYHHRSSYSVLAKQMVHNHLDVVIGGGTRYLDSAGRAHLLERGYALHLDDLAGLRGERRDRVWGLFGSKNLPMDLDRDTGRYPSLAESTAIALRHLSGGDKGFFLMVEGSMVDWAAHSNDPVGVATEFLAFDRACRVALDFARRDGETAVVITSDHGNSGLSIGKESWPDYDEYSADQLFGQLVRIRATAAGMSEFVKRTPPSGLDSLFGAVCGFTLTDAERQMIYQNKGYDHSPLSAAQRAQAAGSLYGSSLQRTVSDIYTGRTSLAFTTHGHTGEDVFLATYHPRGDRPLGVVSNQELHGYLAGLLGYERGIDHLNGKYFAPHTTVFTGQEVRVVARGDKQPPVLEVVRGDRRLRIEPYVSSVEVDGKRRELGSLVVYSPKSKLFYLPRSLSLWYREGQ